jgi:hypothetical protein
MTTKDEVTQDVEGPLGTKRHVGRTGPRVEPVSDLSTLIRFARESVPMSRPQLFRATKQADPAGVGVSVASIHTLEHERTPREGELELLLPVLYTLVGGEKWTELGGNAFYAPATKAPRKPRAKKVA